MAVQGVARHLLLVGSLFPSSFLLLYFLPATLNTFSVALIDDRGVCGGNRESAF
jgi:hypothetical protein